MKFTNIWPSSFITSIFSTTNMLDALQARANELWRTETRKTQVIYTSSNVRSTHEQIRKELAQKKDRQKKMLESELYNIKEKPAPLVQPPAKYLTGLSCKFCTPGNSVSRFLMFFIFVFLKVCDVCIPSFVAIHHTHIEILWVKAKIYI